MISGSAKEVSFDGISYRPVADATINISNTKYKSEAVYTYTSSHEKRTRQGCYVSGIKLEVTTAEYDTLASLHNAHTVEPIKGYFVLGDNSVYQAEGFFSEFGEYDAMEGTVTLKFEAYDKFEVFAG